MSHRTQITLNDEQYERLLQESRRSGLALAELVRRAIDHSYGSMRAADLIRSLDDSFGSWVNRSFDGQAYVEELRRGMARRLAG
jgi:hypothetical protein